VSRDITYYGREWTKPIWHSIKRYRTNGKSYCGHIPEEDGEWWELSKKLWGLECKSCYLAKGKENVKGDKNSVKRKETKGKTSKKGSKNSAL
jgi:hypothetical protein